MNISTNEIARMVDISAVRANSDDEAIDELVSCAVQYHCYLVTVLPAQTLRTKALLAEHGHIRLGGNVGFPSGGQTTTIKAAETRELVAMGCDEIDMVIDIAALLSGRHAHVEADIRAVVDAADRHPVKVILECHYLEAAQIYKGCDLAIQAGAAFVKTGTGWAPSGATLENISLIKGHVGDAIQIKASGGIRDADTLLEMHRRGASRFGISTQSAARIFDSLAARSASNSERNGT